MKQTNFDIGLTLFYSGVMHLDLQKKVPGLSSIT